jgi:hypothetical protein
MKSDTETYVVVVLDDAGRYILATLLIFSTEAEAFRYASGVARDRSPMIIPGGWTNLRDPYRISPPPERKNPLRP